MELKFVYPRWGSAAVKWPDFLAKVKEEGYQRVEADLPLEKSARANILSMLKDFDLEFVGQHWETKETSFEKHIDQYKRHLYNLAEVKPLLVNSQTGMDFFSFEQNKKLLVLGQHIEKETGVIITHETHRSRFSFAPHICHSFLKELPFLNLTADFAHWTCVAESLLENQEEAVNKAISSTYHIHARVGSSQSSQVIDPRDENYSIELKQHKKWWSQMIENAENSGRSFITIAPEYGPSPYGLYHKNTLKPLMNQWEINNFIKNEISAENELNN